MDELQAADLILRVARSLAPTRGLGASESWLIRTTRELVRIAWEDRRLGGQRIGRQHRSEQRWTPEARQIYEAAHGAPSAEEGLVREHVVPANLTARYLLEDPQKLTTQDVLDYLRERAFVVVVGPEDNEALRPWKNTMPDEKEIWSRYIAVGIDPTTIIRLCDSPEWDSVQMNAGSTGSAR